MAKGLIRWRRIPLWRKLMLLSGTMVLLGIAAVVCVYLGVNHSGARAWEKMRQRLDAAGVPSDLRELVPAMPKNADNFAATPLIASLTDFEMPLGKRPFDSVAETAYRDPETRERFLAMRIPDTGDRKVLPNWTLGRPADLGPLAEAWKEEFDLGDEGGSAEVVRRALLRFQGEFAELDAATLRPQAQLPFRVGSNYLEQIYVPLPYLSELFAASCVQAARVSAALEAGDLNEAGRGLRTLSKLAETSDSHPSMYGHSFGMLGWHVFLSEVWQGLEAGRWRAEDLAWIEERLRRTEVFSSGERAIAAEMITFRIALADYMRGDGMIEVARRGHTVFHFVPRPVGRLVPQGVWDHNKAVGCQKVLDFGIFPLRRGDLSRFEDTDRELGRKTPFNFLARIGLPATLETVLRTLFTQTAIDAARVACVLERFALEHGDYPATLDELVPDWLPEVPRDLLDRPEPLRYVRGAFGDRYRIYSVGPDGIDDGGRVEFESEEKRDSRLGDWAWGYRFEEDGP